MRKLRTVSVLSRKEFMEAIKNRWLIGFSAGFCLAGAGISWIGSMSAAVGGYSGFGRTTAALVNMVLLIVPLMGLFIGSLSITGERERGTLALLLSLPVERNEIYWAKWIGMGGALTAALSLAFSLAGIGLALRGGFRDGSIYFACFLVTILLALTSLSMGLAISSFSRRTAPAAGVTLLLWLVLVFGGDIGILGTSLAIKMNPSVLLASAWLNPLSLFRILSIDFLGAHLEMLGPAGHCAEDYLGRWLAPLAAAGLIFWMAAATALAYGVFVRNPLKEN